MQISQESTCVGVFFNKVAGPQNCNFVKKRLHHRFFPENFLNYLEAPISLRIYERLVLKHKCYFIRTSIFKGHLQWLLLTVSGSGLQLYSLIETLVEMFICEFCKTHPDDCICKVWEVFQITSFIGHVWETAYFMHMLQDFNHKIQ